MNPTVAVTGLGYVGLTLALTLAENNWTVYGIEKSPDILKQLKDRTPTFFENGLETLLKKHLGKRLLISDQLPSCLIPTYILCVGTPLQKNKTPRLEAVTAALREIAAHAAEDALIISRSTLPVGTSRKTCLPILKSTQKKLYYAYCPERTCEGAALQELRGLPQIIGGMDEPSTRLAADFFKTITSQCVIAPSLEAAEMVKLLDNSWRDTTFAYANEVASLCETLHLDAREVIGLANAGYRRNAIPQPGPVGGPCLTKDSYLLMHSFSNNSTPLPLIQTAREINKNLCTPVWQRLEQFLQQTRKDKKDLKVFISGLAFKGDPATDDLRDSPALDLIGLLRQQGISAIFGHDFVVKPQKLIQWDIQPLSIEDGFDRADCVLMMNNHPNYSLLDIERLLESTNRPAFFFDAWQNFPKVRIQKMAGIFYGGVGF